MANPEIVAALISLDPAASDRAYWRLVHQDGRPFTDTETELVKNATADDLEEAARHAEATAAGARKGIRVHEAAARVIKSAAGAMTLRDAARIRGRDWRDLVAEEAGLSRAEVGEIVGSAD
jgi:hypothetical protein